MAFVIVLVNGKLDEVDPIAARSAFTSSRFSQDFVGSLRCGRITGDAHDSESGTISVLFLLVRLR